MRPALSRNLRYVMIANSISLPHPGEEHVLVENPDEGIRLIVTDAPDSHRVHGDRSLAAANLLLSGGVDKTTGRFNPALLAAKSDDIRNQRPKGGTFLVMTRRGQVDSFEPVAERDEGDFILTIDGLDATGIRETSASAAARLLTSVRLGSERHIAVESAGDFIILFREDGKPIYPRRMEAGQPRFWMSSPIDSPANVEAMYRATAAETGLARVYELLSSALDTTDPFRAFLWAWTALEIFLVKVHKGYEANFNAALLDAQPSEASRQYLARLRERNHGKHSIRDSFLLVSAVLDPTADADLTDFAAVLDARNPLVHTQEHDTSTLPSAVALRLLSKYLKLHLSASQRRQVRGSSDDLPG